MTKLYSTLHELNQQFRIYEGYCMWDYFYRAEQDPNCIYGNPKLVNSKSSAILDQVEQLLNTK